MQKEYYLKLLNRSFEIEKGLTPIMDSRLEYLSEHVFDFTTYGRDIAELMATKALEVCNAITEKKTFEYIKTEENYVWYIVTCNLPFFNDKLSWGGSIRGAWWDIYGKRFKIASYGFFDEDEEQIMELEFNEKEWTDFIAAMNEFVKGDA